MPLAALKHCPAPACPNCQPCATHKRGGRRAADARRGSSAARGYDGRWQKLRVLILAEEPVCRYCKASGRVTASSTVDHMTPKARGGGDERGNLCGCCDRCNYSKGDKTAAEFLAASRKYHHDL